MISIIDCPPFHPDFSESKYLNVKPEQFKTPILFIIFNRPWTAQKVFDQIRKLRPEKLYVGADGPRPNRPDDLEKCAETRKIIEQIDWPCELKTRFLDHNLGCGEGPSTAISWFFENEPEGIIVEDDCLPSLTFFNYAEELLGRYRNDTRVMMIAANNIENPEDRETDYSYTFSNITYCWGWASWARAWKLFDYKMGHYKEVHAKGYLLSSYRTVYEKTAWEYIFSRMYEGDDRTSRKTIWDYQWQFACMVHSGLIIVPNTNLVENLGFGEGASNTIDPEAFTHVLSSGEMQFPLRHPDFMMVHRERDLRTFKIMHTSATSRWKAILKSLIPTAFVEKVINPFRSKKIFMPRQWGKAFG